MLVSKWICKAKITIKLVDERPKNCVYHINYGVLQGFPALRKAVTTYLKRYRIFSRVYDTANQLLTRHPPFAPFGQEDKRTANTSLFSIRGRLSDFFRIMAVKNTEKSVSLSDSGVQAFLEGEENQNTERKTKVTNSVALVIKFLGAENEIRQLEDL